MSQLFPCIEYLTNYYKVLQTIKIHEIFIAHKADSSEEQELVLTNNNSLLNVDSFVS